jgi:hypothetical protein
MDRFFFILKRIVSAVRKVEFVIGFARGAG